MKTKWQEWIIARSNEGKCESPIERLFVGTHSLVGDHIGFPVAPEAILEQQAGIGPYRVDFLYRCRSVEGGTKLLVVELDGHDFHERTKEQAAKDRSRDRWLIGKGHQVIRFTGSEVWNNPFECLETVRDHIYVITRGVTPQQAKCIAGLEALGALFSEREEG